MNAASTYAPLSGAAPESFKKAFLIFRWLLIIVCSYMILFTSTPAFRAPEAHLFVGLLVLSNIALYLVREETIAKSSFYTAVGITDIILVTVALVISGQTGTDFYMMYFLIIIISALSQDIKRIVLSTVLVMVVHGLTLMSVTYEAALADPAILLRFPFFLVIALFYGYLVQSVRQERLQREKLAQEEVNRLKARFLSRITYELLGPMNVITGYIHLMLTGASGDLTLEQIKIVDHLQLNAEKLLSLIRQLVDLSNIEAKKLTLQVHRAEIKPFFEDIRKEIASEIQDKPIRVEFMPDDHLPPVETDWGRLRQATLHVLAHVMKFTPTGQVTVLARTGPGEDEATLAFVDAGVGVRREDIPRIFEKFTRGDFFGGQNDPALGLAVAIARNLVELLGGKIRVKARAGKGSDFAVTVPIAWGNKPKEAIGISLVEPFEPTS